MKWRIIFPRVFWLLFEAMSKSNPSGAFEVVFNGSNRLDNSALFHKKITYVFIIYSQENGKTNN